METKCFSKLFVWFVTPFDKIRGSMVCCRGRPRVDPDQLLFQHVDWSRRTWILVNRCCFCALFLSLCCFFGYILALFLLDYLLQLCRFYWKYLSKNKLCLKSATKTVWKSVCDSYFCLPFFTFVFSVYLPSICLPAVMLSRCVYHQNYTFDIYNMNCMRFKLLFELLVVNPVISWFINVKLIYSLYKWIRLQ